MKIAIHKREESFSDHWIPYCKENNIDFKIVNCYNSNILEELKDCDILLFHWIQWHSRDILFAKQLIYSAELMGIKVFPNTHTSQFFDDKLGQKYLFEALDLQFIKSHAFYYKKDAVQFLNETTYPTVFKLRGGASSVNVKLIKSKKQGLKFVNKAFSKGFSANDRFANLKDRIRKFRKEKSWERFIHTIKGFVRIVHPNEHDRVRPKEKSYVLFQDFLPNNEYDIRVTIVGDKAFTLKRYIRKNDFRASGSGSMSYDPKDIEREYLDLAFEMYEKLNMQSVSFDFLRNKEQIYLCEISYSFVVLPWPGYWTKEKKWVDGYYSPINFILENMINEFKETHTLQNKQQDD